MLGQRLRRWHNIKTALGQRLVLARSLAKFFTPVEYKYWDIMIQRAIRDVVLMVDQRRRRWYINQTTSGQRLVLDSEDPLAKVIHCVDAVNVDSIMSQYPQQLEQN